MQCELVQLSDPHFGTERPAVVRAALQLVGRLRPRLAVLSGDITQRARRPEFEAAARFCSALAVDQVLAVPGNHDMPLFNLAARALWPFAGYRRAFGAALEPQWSSPTLQVLGVNTARPWRHEDGQVNAAQVGAVAHALSQSPRGALRVVVAHHPFAAAEASDRGNLLHGRAAAAAAWSAAGADLVLGGHIHLPYVLPLHQQAGWALPRHLWCVQAGTVVSARVRPPAGNSLNAVFADAAQPPHRRSCLVEQWDYDEAGRAFVLARRHVLALSPPPAWACATPQCVNGS